MGTVTVDLNDLLEEYICKRDNASYAYRIDVGAKDKRTSRTTTVVSMWVRGTIDSAGAIELLREVEDTINNKLRLDQRPEILEFYLDDDCPGHIYRAISRRIEGTLIAIDAARQIPYVVTDGEKTRPATPEGDSATEDQKVINVEI
ncbi:hypothetical protein F5Y11DRAFT_332644 [Daldinia sp. FL1419]|nr:hypothetical protein F5Y11DRAFT_332644 [Daldinia sp. FL1419]